ncbi:uncharacterized protein P174DRAFT_415655 [Aspergillus novofumigatus IBT 16806]|uniref:Uncharacterized protein n=1 Tax=Aspergillus novofumigatus (strain IBT 16806) TaxID=1392255 RepID=A0A2I1CJR0_ASPN1|nr:uncharacterized protein P174DRAFT_415655 [Aspergillus novofumigatus IBT 16806]PKX97860.1 hypothetical protein P174DRAFT_415655 [Aspergillus novofumigatus IBT 16806]
MGSIGSRERFANSVQYTPLWAPAAGEEIDNFAVSKRVMTFLKARQVWNVVSQRPDSQFKFDLNTARPWAA